jgi:UDP-glucose 4-epimerase
MVNAMKISYIFYICIRTHIYVNIYMFIYTHTYTYTNIYIYIYVYIGTGIGYSVLDMVNAMKVASGRPLPYEFGPRREV